MYDQLRHLADSWGLVGLGVTFLVMVAWALRPSARDQYRDAATSIFDEEKDDG